MKKIYKSSLLVLMAAALLFSCKKDISQIGVDVVGENPLEVIYVDTFSIVAHSEIVDSMPTDDLSSHMFGAYKDPVFGTLNTSIYSQFRLDASNTGFIFPDDAVYDSIILYLDYADTVVYGGNSLNPSQNHISIYEVGDQLEEEETYYHFQNLRTKDELLGDMVFIPSFDSVDFYEYDADSTVVDSGRRIPPLAVPLSDELGLRFFEYGPDVYESNETFLAEFAGLYMTTLDQHLPSSDGSIVNFSFLTNETKISLYYHYTDTVDETVTPIETRVVHESFDLICNTNTVRFGNYNHYDYFDASPEFKAQVIDGNTDLGEEVLYLQSLAGVRTYISFPHLNKMDDYYNYAVNEAKLFLWDVDDPSSQLAPISALSLSYQVDVDSSLLYYSVPDVSGGSNYFNGDYSESQENYFFRITQYLQDLIRGDTENNEIRVEIIGGAVNANRSIIGGYNPMDETKKLKLEVIYTKIDADE